MTDALPLPSALADRYRLDREVGQGGMATVYLAHDIRHDRIDVAPAVVVYPEDVRGRQRVTGSERRILDERRGWIEGRNLTISAYWATGQQEMDAVGHTLAASDPELLHAMTKYQAELAATISEKDADVRKRYGSG